MKVVLGEEMARVEQLSYQKEGHEIAEKYMETAGKSIAEYCLSVLKKKAPNKIKLILLLCTKGNNSGDAYVCGRYLLKNNMKVTAFRPEDLKNESKLCQINRLRFKKAGGNEIFSLQQKYIETYDLVIDGLLGIGFKNSLKKNIKDIIEIVNHTTKPIVSIDVPSGIHASKGFDSKNDKTAIKATTTLTLGLPKLGLFIQESPNYVGEICCLSFGIKDYYLKQAKSNFSLVTKKHIDPLVPRSKRIQHKYSVGSVGALAGSAGMLGAAMLSSKAAFRAGSGIVKLLLEQEVYKKNLLFPELVTTVYKYSDKPSDVINHLNQAKSCYIGPGLGCSAAISNLLKNVIPAITAPLVLDADAINIYAKEKFKLPKNTILTPHLGEAKRLLGLQDSFKITSDNLEKVQQFSIETSTYIVLKGYPTFVFSPAQSTHILPIGDPGMATAGSGDVLTGTIASFLSQGLTPLSACLFGVWIHGRAGSLAAKKHTSFSLMATDIIEFIGEALKEIRK